MTQFFVWQPVDVCTDNPRFRTDCAFINNNLETVLSSSYDCVANGVDTKCANLYAGFIDPGTGMLAHRNIWSAVGLDFRQTPVVQYNSTASQSLKIDSCTSGTTGCTSSSFSTLAQQPDISTMTNPPTPPNVPTFPRSPSPTTINAFFVTNICSTSNTTCTTETPRGDLDGFGALNGNAMAVANLVFLPATTGRPDTPAHEGGHTFALDHTIFGAGDTVPTNLMTAGGFRMVPTPTNVPGSAPLTAEWVLEVSPNGSALDFLTTGGSCTSIDPTDPDYPNCTQQTAALLSGFLNATPQAAALVCPTFGCEEESVQTAAAASPSTTHRHPAPIAIQISGGFSDACFNNSPVCANAFLAKVVIALTQGKFNNNFTVTSSSTSPVLAAKPRIFSRGHENEDRGHENEFSRGHENEFSRGHEDEDDESKGICLSLSPNASCLKLSFVPGAITGSNFGFLNFTIGTKPSDPNQLAGTTCYFWDSAPGVPYYNSCSDFSPGNGVQSNSQMVNLAINPLIPLNFLGTPGHKPCTIVPPATSCSDPTSTYTNDTEESSGLPSDRR
jgi:hypothetical protein